MTVEIVRGDVHFVRLGRSGNLHRLPHTVSDAIDNGHVHRLGLEVSSRISTSGGRRRWQYGSHQEPVFSIDAQGSCFGNGSLACSSSIEIPSGHFTNAMWPSRGGREIVTPLSISF